MGNADFSGRPIQSERLTDVERRRAASMDGRIRRRLEDLGRIRVADDLRELLRKNPDKSYSS